ncbi:MAG: group II intron maturase-specific domain-containing protein [Clostridia bacterium]|nr:group II intron maturase-specific domain-containing protein [Clostridia bacterium]
MELIVSNSNVVSACKRVEQNKGAAGIDGMRVGELRPYLHVHWAELKQSLLSGTCRPSPVRRHEIPKPGGGVRLLGIPTALDRFIQQAVLQVLTPLFEPTFSEHSYGFRPGKSMASRIRELNSYLRGWMGYYRIARTPSVCQEMDQWIRRRLRMCLLKQWKRPKTVRRNLVALGIPDEWAQKISGSRKAYWRLANTPQVNKALGIAHWRNQGLLSLTDLYAQNS